MSAEAVITSQWEWGNDTPGRRTIYFIYRRMPNGETEYLNDKRGRLRQWKSQEAVKRALRRVNHVRTPGNEPMPKYEIEQYEIHIAKYRVEAESKAAAIQKLFEGELEPVDGSLEYVEVAEEIGLPVDEYRDLADDLRSLGVLIGHDVIPSIRSVEEIE